MIPVFGTKAGLYELIFQPIIEGGHIIIIIIIFHLKKKKFKQKLSLKKI
jgi:hypothetical protein